MHPLHHRPSTPDVASSSWPRPSLAADTDWARVPKLTPHPYEYPPSELSDALLLHLRRPRLPGCGHAAQAAATAAGAFVAAADLAAELSVGAAGGLAAPQLGVTCGWLERRVAQHAEQHRPLGARCRLLARKFKAGTTAAALAAVAPCDSAALVLNDGTCPGETPRQAARRRAWQRAAPVLLLGGGGLVLVPLLAALALGLAAPFVAGLRRGRPLT